MPRLERIETQYQLQANAIIAQANPVQNTWYTVMDTKVNCRVIACAFMVEVANETIELRLTVDGQVLTGSQAANFGTIYYLGLIPYFTANSLQILGVDVNAYRAFAIEARSIKVEVRKTTAAGAGNLNGWVIYQTR